MGAGVGSPGLGDFLAGLDDVPLALVRVVRCREFVLARLDAPDLARVLRDRPVAGELARRRDVHQRHLQPLVRVLSHAK